MREDRLGRREVLQERLLPLIDATDAQAPDVEAALLSSESLRRAADARPAVAGRLPAGAGAAPARARRRAPRPVPPQPAPGRAAPRAGVAGEPRRPGAGPDARAACRGRAGQRDERRRAALRGRAASTSRPTRRGGAPRSRRSSARSARIMLVPLDRLEDFSAAIDGLRLRGRLTFEGVELDLPDLGPADPERVAGKLVFKDSPFSGWVQAHVGEASRNALCVESADGLARRRLPGHPRRPDAQRPARRPRAQRHPQHHRLLQRRRDRRGRRGARRPRGAARRSGRRGRPARPAARGCWSSSGRRTTSWPPRGSTTSTSTAATGASPSSSVGGPRSSTPTTTSRRCDAQIADLTARLEETRRARYAAEQRQRELNAAHGDLVDAEDVVNDRLQAMEEAGRVALSRGAGGRPRGRLRRRRVARRPRRPRPVRRDLPAARRAAARPRSATPRPRSAGSTTTSPRCSASTSSSGTRPTSARPRTPTPTTPASSTTSAARASPPGGPSGDAGSRSGAARTWCPSSARWPRPSRRSRTGSSRSTRSCDAWSSARRGTGCGSACGGCRPPTSRRS